MRILAVFPGLNPKFDDLAHAMEALAAMGNEVMVLAGRLSRLKSGEAASEFEHVGRVVYYRPYSSVQEMQTQGPVLNEDIQERVASFAPEVVFASSFRSLPVAKALQSAGIHVPILMRVEHLDPIQAIYGRRRYLGIPALGRLLGRAKWRRHGKCLQGVVTTNPADLFNSPGNLGVDADRIFFAPHCNQLPQLAASPPPRDKNLMAYVGSLIRDKNCDRWPGNVRRIFDQTPVERFLIVGDGAYRPVVEQLRSEFGQRIEHIITMPRTEALERLRSAYFAYTAATYGWGFIGDCWATGTPLLAPNSTYGLVRYVDALVPKDARQMIADVNRLHRDPALHSALAAEGLRRYEHFHTADVVARHYLAAICAVVDRGAATI